MTQHESGELNGHHISWPQMFGIMSDILHKVGGLQTGQEMTREEVRSGLIRVHERIDNLHLHGHQQIHHLHGRVTVLEAAPKPERRGWIQSTGLSPRELISLVILVIMSLTGTLTSDVMVAWLSH
jgi:hypothetical protein